MKFKAPGNSPVQVSLTSGHIAIVTPEGGELDPMFQREAIAKGCIPVGIETSDEPQEESGFNRAEVIRNAINAMLAGHEEGDFTNDGKPDIRKLNGRVGFTVTREERDAIWAEIEAS